ncbi:hypothetical protein COCNU_scaffold000257G000010 [Cocos nucifera]|nr:hypothetical protein [Cocos nucifera]
MSMNRADEVDYMTDESEMGNAMDDEMEGNFFDTDRGRGEADDEYDLLTRVTDTSSAQARSGRDIQGIPWDRLQITRQNYRQTRIQQYKNYENIPSSGERMNKKCKQVEKGGNYYEFQYNTRLVKPTILHFQVLGLLDRQFTKTSLDISDFYLAIYSTLGTYHEEIVWSFSSSLSTCPFGLVGPP